jgi:hypothetical protein
LLPESIALVIKSLCPVTYYRDGAESDL